MASSFSMWARVRNQVILTPARRASRLEPQNIGLLPSHVENGAAW